MVAIKTTNLPGVLPHFGASRPGMVTTSPASEMADPLSPEGQETRPLQKTQSQGVREQVKRSLSARGIIRSPSMPATTALQQTRSEAGGKPRLAVDPAVKPRTGSLLSLGSLRSSPAPTTQPSPLSTVTQSPLPSTLEGSYVSKASLRLNEAVNHVFPVGPQPAAALHAATTYKGRIPPSSERAKELASVVVSEVQACLHDQYLLKTLLRNAMTKAMSILLSRIEGLMILPGSEPTLLTIPASSRTATPTPSQRFAFEVVHCAYEVRRGLEAAIDLDGAPNLVRESFKPWIAKLEAVPSRIVGPLLLELKQELVKRVRLIGSAELHVAHASSLRSIGLGRSTPTLNEPAPLRELADMLDIAHKMLESIHCPDDAEKWAVGLATTVVWKGMLALVSHNMATETEAVGGMQKRSTLNLHKSGKRSPSPPLNGTTQRLRMPQARFLHDAETLHALVVRFTDHVGRLAPLNPAEKPKDACSGCHICAGTVLPDDLTSDSDSDADDPRRLAQEAMHEALLALASLTVVLRACASGAAGATAVRADQTGPCATLRRSLDTCPPLILLHLLASQIPKERGLRLPHEVWGVGWAEYDGSLRGFASGEEWTAEVALEMLREAQRVRKEEEAAGRPFVGAEADWLAALEAESLAHSSEN